MRGTVVQVTTWNSPYLGNLMHSQLRLAAAVREQLGLDTHFVLGPGADDSHLRGAARDPGTTWSVSPLGARAVAGHLRAVTARFAPALLHSHFTMQDLETAAVARARDVPCLWHMHTGFEGYPAAQRVKDLLKMRVVARTSVDRIVAVSPWLAELAARRGAPPSRVVTIPNAIVTERFARLPAKEAARVALGLDPFEPLVLAMAWWPEAKGGDILLDALRLLADEGRPVHALVVGEDRLRGLIAARGLTDAPWLHVSGFVADPGPLFAAADLFVSASRHEGSPYAIGEAMAADREVLMTDIPGVAAFVGAPGTSTVQTENPRALADGLRARLDAPRSAPGEIAGWARATIDIDRWSAQMVDLYRTLLPTTRRASTSGR